MAVLNIGKLLAIQKRNKLTKIDILKSLEKTIYFIPIYLKCYIFLEYFILYKENSRKAKRLIIMKKTINQKTIQKKKTPGKDNFTDEF